MLLRNYIVSFVKNTVEHIGVLVPSVRNIEIPIRNTQVELNDDFCKRSTYRILITMIWNRAIYNDHT